MARKLTDEISLEELKQLREEGLTNKQIADRLDINYVTVKRYLGKQPDGLRAAYGSNQTKVKDVEKPAMQVVQAPKTDLILTQCTKEYAGKDVCYVVRGWCVEIQQNGQQIRFYDRKGLENFVMELMDLIGREQDA